MTLKEVIQEAKSVGLSYGQYVAQYRPTEEIPKPAQQEIKIRKPYRLSPIKQAEKEQRDELIVQAYKEKQNLEQVAQLIGITTTTVRKILKQNNIQVLSNKAKSKELWEKHKAYILQALDRGDSVSKIVSDTKLSHSVLYRRFQIEGIAFKQKQKKENKQ